MIFFPDRPLDILPEFFFNILRFIAAVASLNIQG
jgi:hypothetical protein